MGAQGTGVIRASLNRGRDASCSPPPFELSVSNQGYPIPAETIKDLFKPFVRATARPSQPSLGLGLYIASEIARAHGGTLTVESLYDETRFTFRMPAN